jgi:anaerobic magnesium-protoporphyrin IX monomethyl ester cyclase
MRKMMFSHVNKGTLTTPMDIGFVLSTSRQDYDPFRNQPLSALYLLTILEEHFGSKVDVSLIDLRGHTDTPDLTAIIPGKDVYLYSVTSLESVELFSLVRDLRRKYPNAMHVAGGPHITIDPEGSKPHFDAIVTGEGEESIIQLICDIGSKHLKPIYQQTRIPDLDHYPYPLRKFLPDKYVASKGLLDWPHTDLLATTAIFSRGCPFNCYFCANKHLMLGPVRYRSPNLVVDEIEYLKREYGIQALAIKDDNSIPVTRKAAIPFLEAIAKTGILWRGQSRANGIDEDTVILAKQSGCTDIAIGIESASQSVLDLINKRIDLGKAREYIWFLHRHGIGVRLHFILGLPGEDESIAEKTIAFINETSPRSVLLSLLAPRPGSEFYEKPRKFGMNLNSDVGFDKYQSAFGRFEENEKPHLVFEYDRETPWGRAMAPDQIMNIYMQLQAVLRERKLNF